MKPLLYIGIFLIGALILSCGKKHSYQERTEETEIETYELITIDTFYIDEREANSNYWKEYHRNSSYNNSTQQIEL